MSAFILTYEPPGRNGVGRIVLDNPPYNTLTDPVFTDPDGLAAFLSHPALIALIVTGAGRHFCGGADLDAIRRAGPELAARLDKGKALLDLLRFAPVPSVAVIRGSCLGAGLEFALACTFRFAAENALLGFPESAHGLMPGMGGTLAAAEGVGRGVLVELALSGRMVRAGEALTLGLVDRCLPAAQTAPAAVSFLENLTGRRSVHCVRSIMTSIANAARLPRDRALAEESRLFWELASSQPEPEP